LFSLPSVSKSDRQEPAHAIINPRLALADGGGGAEAMNPEGFTPANKMLSQSG
jgi:hypothetical protein